MTLISDIEYAASQRAKAICSAWVGLLWMSGYWATLIPAWMYCNVAVFSTS